MHRGYDCFIFFFAIRPSPFFSLFSVVRPTQIFAFSKKKKLRRRQWHIISNNCHFNLKQASNNDVDFSFFHCRHVDFVTTPCCFQAPRILCWGTGPPSSRLLFQFYFFIVFFHFRPTDPKSENAFDNKRKKKGGWPKRRKKVLKGEWFTQVT